MQQILQLKILRFSDAFNNISVFYQEASFLFSASSPNCFGAVFKILKKVLISSSPNCFWAAVKINALLCTKSSEAKALQKSFLVVFPSDDIYLSHNIYLSYNIYLLVNNSSTLKRVLYATLLLLVFAYLSQTTQIISLIVSPCYPVPTQPPIIGYKSK